MPNSHDLKSKLRMVRSWSFVPAVMGSGPGRLRVSLGFPALGGLVLFTLLGGGCADYRISMAELTRMEQSAREQAAPPSPEQLEAIESLMDRQLGPYRVGPSDVLAVTLTTGETPVPFSPLTVRVYQDGAVDLPLVGPVVVSEKTLGETERAIQEAYQRGVFADVKVHVETTVPDVTKVFVRGAVALPGMVQLTRTERNLLFAVVGAGGAGTEASGEVTLHRLRNPTEEVTLDLSDPTELRAALALEPLESGDSVEVHAAFPNTVFVGGLVNAPRPIAFDPGVEVDVLRAIAASGGLRTDVSPTEATLTRRLADGRDVHVKLVLDRINRGADPNITLIPGDILWVPETTLTFIQDFINKNIYLRAGASVTYSVSGVEYMNRRSSQSRQGGGGDLQNSFDPLGFLGQNAALQTLTARPAVVP
jgi:protein involved in polysaccharide export with SLBB domain